MTRVLDNFRVNTLLVAGIIYYYILLIIADAELMPDFFLESLDTVHSSQYKIQLTGKATPVTSASSMGKSAPPPAAAAAPSGGGGDEGGEIVQIFSKIKGLVDPDMIKKTNAVFQFDVKGLKRRLIRMKHKNCY